MTDARPSPPPRPVAVHLVAILVAVAGLFQLIASVALGLATPQALHRAAREGPRVYILAALLLAACALIAWLLRRRRLPAALLAAAGPIAAAVTLWYGDISRLGLAYHGELILHHFITLLCATLLVAIPLQWGFDPRLGGRRWLPAAPAVLGALLLLAEHLIAPPQSELAGPIGQVGTAMSLATWPIALLALWPTLGPRRLRLWLILSALPAVVRVALGGAGALAGVPLGLAAAAPIMSAVIVASLAGMLLLRPQLDRLLQIVITAGAGVMTLGLYRVYLLRFGDLEGDLGGLVRSLFGFDLPYPGYVPEWQLGGAMLGVFVLLATLSGALVSARDHIRGLGLTIMVTAGLGLTDPQLVLMLTAGYLILLDATAGTPPDAAVTLARAEPPPAPLDATLLELATRLALPPPVSLEQADGRVLSLRGALEHTHLQLRAREGRRGWQVELTLGVPGRDTPEVELLPGAGGHRVRGNVRRLEQLPEALLASLADYPGHRTRIWAGGVQLDFGQQLGGMDPDRLARLLMQLIRVV